MKILYVSKVSPNLGIPHVHEVATRLAARGHDVRVISAATRAGQRRHDRIDGLEITALPTAPGALRERGRLGFFASRMPFYLLAAGVVARRFRDVDLIIEDVAPLRAPLLPNVAARLGIPLIYQTHNAYPKLDSWTSTYGAKGFAGWVWDRLFRRKPKCAALFADAKYTADSYAGIGCEVRWIPNGIDSTQFSPRTGEREPGAPLELISVGRIVDLKNHRLLIEALAASRSGARLTIVGDGPARPGLEALAAARGVSDRVTFTGFMEKSLIHEAYRNADLFVLPSFWEGLPHVVLEAMASGLPIAMSDIDAAEGLVLPEYGWRLPTRQAAAWTDLFDRLVGEEVALAEMGRAARKAAVAWPDWEEITDDVLDLIARVRADAA